MANNGLTLSRLQTCSFNCSSLAATVSNGRVLPPRVPGERRHLFACLIQTQTCQITGINQVQWACTQTRLPRQPPGNLRVRKIPPVATNISDYTTFTECLQRSVALLRGNRLRHTRDGRARLTAYLCLHHSRLIHIRLRWLSTGAGEGRTITNKSEDAWSTTESKTQYWNRKQCTSLNQRLGPLESHTWEFE